MAERRLGFPAASLRFSFVGSGRHGRERTDKRWITRPEPQRGLQFSNGFGRPPALVQHNSQIVAEGRVIRLDSNGFRELVDCIIRPTLVDTRRRQIVVSLGVIRPDRYRSRVVFDRLVEFSFIRQRDAKVILGAIIP